MAPKQSSFLSGTSTATLDPFVTGFRQLLMALLVKVLHLTLPNFYFVKQSKLFFMSAAIQNMFRDYGVPFTYQYHRNWGNPGALVQQCSNLIYPAEIPNSFVT